MTTTQWAEINFDVQNVPSRPNDEVTTVNVIDTDRIIAAMISDLEYQYALVFHTYGVRCVSYVPPPILWPTKILCQPH